MSRRTGSWVSSIPVAESRHLPPDPRFMEAIGRNHALETALADLIDNSIDAGAGKVLIRFVRAGSRLVGLYVVDDGRGMSDDEIDRAMTIGASRDYGDTDLGHFGIGMKAASLGQAGSLTVLSRSDAQEAVGRRWLLARATQGFECDVVAADFAAELLETDWAVVGRGAATVVRWDEIRAFPTSSDAGVTDRYIEDVTVRLRHHLGLVFHRLLVAGDLRIALDIEDAGGVEAGPTFLAEPVDPFAYARSGHPDYPKTLSSGAGAGDLSLKCHIWPGRSQLPGFKLDGRPDLGQGFYFYRHNRLLQSGGWNGVFHADRHHQLARVVIDIGPAYASMLKMNPEKTRIEANADFAEAIGQARAEDGSDFTSYLEAASGTQRESSRRTRSRPRVVEPGRGFAPPVRRAIAREMEFLAGEEPIEVRWTSLDDDLFFEIDREEHVIWLNRQYRWAVIGDRESSLNDAPVVKALLFLLMEDLFRGAYLGAKDRDNIALWQEILTAAARAEPQ